jgi:decaprenylphospho-beta-D-ribofuranose 2-oxidase
MRWREQTLSGWGRSHAARMRACRPESIKELGALLAQAQAGGILAFGAGRSYGDAALNRGGQVMLTERLNRFIDFDAESGALVCEPGVTFDDLRRVFLRRGWWTPVSPGTAFATIGGALANDVHGKNHEHAGSFGDHVQWIDLLTASGELRRISPDNDSELFAATIGGIGLTGVMAQICFRMQRIASPSVIVEERRMANLDAFLSTFLGGSAGATYSVGWVDGLARGAALGRGILQTADPADGDEDDLGAAKRARPIPFDWPAAALNPLTVGLFNAAYFRRVPAQGRSRRMTLPKFLYPLDGLRDWNRIYGKRGFYQFQCVIPTAESARGIPRLLQAIAQSRSASFLAVIKMMGREGRGHLSFAMPGCTLALDFPASQASRDLLGALERITLDHGGRVYLAKDALLSPDGFARMYPKLDRFRGVLAAIDPEQRFCSDMMRRLAIRPAAGAVLTAAA